eukprot:COSAG04_NODE_2330_length_4324_cov_2.131124_3_plen_156_part_00
MLSAAGTPAAKRSRPADDNDTPGPLLATKGGKPLWTLTAKCHIGQQARFGSIFTRYGGKILDAEHAGIFLAVVMRDPDSVMRSGRTLGEQLGSGQLEYWFVPLLFMRLVGVLTGYGAKLNFETGDEEHKTHTARVNVPLGPLRGAGLMSLGSGYA